MFGEERWIRRGHRQRKQDAGDGRNSADYELHTPTPLNNGGRRKYVLNDKGESCGGNHSQGGVALSKEEWEGSGQVPFLLAERARSEGARSMRAVKGSLGHSPKG